MAYTRRNTTDGVTRMNKDLYDNLQDGIEERGVTPEMFGAKGDGITDDTEAVQKCFLSHKNIFLTGKYLVTKSVTIDNQVSVLGNNGTNRNTGINFMPESEDLPLFIISSSGNSFKNVSLWHDDSDGRGLMGICFKHISTDGNNDLFCSNCHFYGWNIVDYGQGRGHTFKSCLISVCKNLITVEYNFPVSSAEDDMQGILGFRRISVTENQFHSMHGHSLENSAIIILRDLTNEHDCLGLEVLNNYMDSSAPFIYSEVSLDGFIFSNNTIINLIANRHVIHCSGTIKNSIIQSNIVDNKEVDGSSNAYIIFSPIKCGSLLNSSVINNIIHAFIGGRFIEHTSNSDKKYFSYNILRGNYMGNSDRNQLYPNRSFCIIESNYYTNLTFLDGQNSNIEKDNIQIAY